MDVDIVVAAEHDNQAHVFAALATLGVATRTEGRLGDARASRLRVGTVLLEHEGQVLANEL